MFVNCLHKCTVIGFSVNLVRGQFPTLNNKDSSHIKKNNDILLPTNARLDLYDITKKDD